MARKLAWATAVSGVLLGNLLFFAAWPSRASSLATVPRVNAPYFVGPVVYEQAGVFWLGRVTPAENYADVRVGYNDAELYINVAVFDRRLWYDEVPQAADLTNWDSVTLYLDTGGPTGTAPRATSFRLDGQLSWWETPRTPWQAAYRGNGSAWVSATVPFTTKIDWRGDVPNSQYDDRGWYITFRIPFTSLSLPQRPPPGAVWGLTVVVHDRDDAAAAPLAAPQWPATADWARSSTWGELAFGLPTFTPQPAVLLKSVLIRNGLNGAIVTDGAVGGGTLCGDAAKSNYFALWGALKYFHATYFNVQNQGDISDWPCFSKYFVAFPLTAIPPGRVIVSATLTLHQFGNAGQGQQPKPTFLQVLTTDPGWDASQLTWNTAPLARENVSGAWVDPLSQYPGYPGVPHTWDVSVAVAKAYAVGEPLGLAVYSSDWNYHSGRYFYSSYVEELNAAGRPTLNVIYGEPMVSIRNTVSPVAASYGQHLTYTLALAGNGGMLTVTHHLPPQVSAPGALIVNGSGSASYDTADHQVSWKGSPQFGAAVTITIPVTVTASGTQAVSNTAILTDRYALTATAQSLFVIDARQQWLPLALK
jgi:hypothetical protein